MILTQHGGTFVVLQKREGGHWCFAIVSYTAVLLQKAQLYVASLKISEIFRHV